MTESSPEAVERQLERDRAEIDETLDAIGRRLSPGQLLDNTMGYFRAGGSELGSSLARSVKANPFPVILTGVGLAWLMSTSSSGDGAGRHESMGEYVRDSNTREIERARAAAASLTRNAGETEDAFRERVTEAKARALSIKRNADETAKAFKQRVDDYISRAEAAVSDTKEQARSAWSSGSEAAGHQSRQMAPRARQGRQRIADLYASEPLIVGAIGLAAGAVIAALLPLTRSEDEALGEVGDEVREKAREAASTAADRATTATEKAARAVEDEIDRATD